MSDFMAGGDVAREKMLACLRRPLQFADIQMELE